ncbi:hypothetical protein ACFPH6_04570 [Streptomyces xiangluensis]|uniref:Uncharacterized protein n=1 Tax=Streptomyces xiangluensis TaxID=2665720 RepID=A0ABV8YEW8_9ACTN
MSYDLKAVVAGSGLLTAVTAELPSARIARLRHGLALIPMTDALLVAPGEGSQIRRTGFWNLTAAFDQLLAEWSKTGPVAYVEAEYFGGVGEENAAVWRDGSVVLGPLHLLEGETAPVEGTPICRVLRELGVTAGAAQDEFTIVGLGDHRDGEGWLS